jgi:hypothetical protein
MNNGQRSNILSEKFIRESNGFLVVMPEEAGNPGREVPGFRIAQPRTVIRLPRMTNELPRSKLTGITT